MIYLLLNIYLFNLIVLFNGNNILFKYKLRLKNKLKIEDINVFKQKYNTIFMEVYLFLHSLLRCYNFSIN